MLITHSGEQPSSPASKNSHLFGFFIFLKFVAIFCERPSICKELWSIGRQSKQTRHQRSKPASKQADYQAVKLEVKSYKYHAVADTNWGSWISYFLFNYAIIRFKHVDSIHTYPMNGQEAAQVTKTHWKIR